MAILVQQCRSRVGRQLSTCDDIHSLNFVSSDNLSLVVINKRGSSYQYSCNVEVWISMLM